MALVIDATIGGADANSYLTLAEAETYFEGRLHSSNWTGATEADKKSALVMSARMIDQTFAWQGSRASTTQALDWPRSSVVDCEGASVLSTIIPTQIQSAQCEQSLALLSFDLTKKPAALFLGVKKGEIKGGVMAEMDLSFQPDTIDKMTSISIGCLGKLSSGAGGGLLTRY